MEIHDKARVTGKLQKQAQNMVWDENLSYKKMLPLNKSVILQRLHNGVLSLNGLVSLVSKHGYELKIEIVKR